MPDLLKYAIVERERRLLVDSIPTGVSETIDITDRYVVGTRLRLREAVTSSGEVTRKLGHKVRLADGPAEVACTSMYLDDDEWRILCELPATVLHKKRHRVERDGLVVAVDELADGTLLAEIDDGAAPREVVPVWLDVVRDVSADERWTGSQLAR